MSNSFPVRAWRALCQHLSHAEAEGNKRFFILLLRLENLPLLSQHLGQSGIAHLMVRLSIRLGGALRPHDAVEIVAPGVFAIRLRGKTDAHALSIGQRLQEKGQAALSVSEQRVTPVLTGVVIAGNGVTKVMMIDQGLQQLTRLRPGELGRINMFEAHPDNLPQQLPVSIAQAAQTGQMVAYFQPQLCCHTGRVTGFETLARWHHPSRGTLPPGAFMPGMTNADHHALTLAILQQALSALKHWDEAGHDVPTVALNVSNCELGKADFADSLLQELERRNLAPERLVLEILESVGPVTSSGEARENLSRLAAAGCRLDLDDFGTGYASLDAIRKFGIHRIKIDRSFIIACDVDPAQQRMVLAILALAERLGIAALAEGVETQEEHSFLAQLGCDEVQGYAIAHPMPLRETMDFLTAHANRVERLPRLEQRKTG
ncbi:EAL domain-containing protein [Paracoccus sp. (in: a-proteobacteria)]|uniref:EAL domain-containing protein n=1 Tax=Paracoccus sp. TaxID=267 RepID=UPI003A896805